MVLIVLLQHDGAVARRRRRRGALELGAVVADEPVRALAPPVAALAVRGALVGAEGHPRVAREPAPASVCLIPNQVLRYLPLVQPARIHM